MMSRQSILSGNISLLSFWPISSHFSDNFSFTHLIVSNSCELTKKTLNSTLFKVYYKKRLINDVWKMWLSILNQPQYLTKNTSAKMWRFNYDMVWLKSILSPTFIMRPLFKHKWILQHVGHKRSCHYACMTLPRIFCRVVTISKVRNTFYNHPFNLKIMCGSKKAWKKQQQITKNSRCKQIHQWASQPGLIKMWQHKQYYLPCKQVGRI